MHNHLHRLILFFVLAEPLVTLTIHWYHVLGIWVPLTVILVLESTHKAVAECSHRCLIIGAKRFVTQYSVEIAVVFLESSFTMFGVTFLALLLNFEPLIRHNEKVRERLNQREEERRVKRYQG